MRALRAPRPQTQPLHRICTRTELEPGPWLAGHQQKPNRQEPRPTPRLRSSGRDAGAQPSPVDRRPLTVQGHTAAAAGHCPRCEQQPGAAVAAAVHCHGASALGESMACTPNAFPGVQVGCKVKTITHRLKCCGSNRNQATTHGKGKISSRRTPCSSLATTLAVFCFSHNPFEMINRMSHEVVLLWKLSQ